MVEMVGVAVGSPPGPRITHCSLLVRPGEVVAVAGGVGAGKSLLLDVLTGRRRASRGASQILGFDTADQAEEVRRRVTHIPADGRVDESLTFRQQLIWWALLLKLETESASIRQALRHAEVPDRYFDVRESHAPPECRVLVWLALARLRDHQVLLIDDPVRSVSISGARRLARVFREYSRTGGSLLVMTRDAAFADAVADSVVVLENGTTLSSRPALSLSPNLHSGT